MIYLVNDFVPQTGYGSCSFLWVRLCCGKKGKILRKTTLPVVEVPPHWFTPVALLMPVLKINTWCCIVKLSRTVQSTNQSPDIGVNCTIADWLNLITFGYNFLFKPPLNESVETYGNTGSTVDFARHQFRVQTLIQILI